MSIFSRRSILGGFAAATAVPAAVAAAPPTAAGGPLLSAPITPDQYIAEMHAIGWECFSGYYIGRGGLQIQTRGIIERCDDVWHESDENLIRRRQLNRAIAASGIDFYERASARLFELGYRENVRS
jgi:hypothetical protein